MKLRGSLAEQEYRRELTKGRISLFQDSEKQRLLESLKRCFPEMKTAYILGFTPEQTEDIYRLLVNENIIAIVEIDRLNVGVEPHIERFSIPSYLKGLSKRSQIQLAVAMDLAKNEH